MKSIIYIPSNIIYTSFIFNILHIYNYQGERTEDERVLGRTGNRVNGPGTFSRLLMDHYMIELENTTTFLDCFKSVAHAAALGSSSFSHELRSPSPKDEVECYISTTKNYHDRIRVSPTLNIKASLESFVDFEILRNEWSGDENTQTVKLVLKEMHSQYY